jgi:hypothetical protein
MAHTYYLLDKQGDIQQINLRDIPSACAEPEAAETLRQYMRWEKLKPEKQSDMIRLIMYLNRQTTLA